MRIKPAKLLLCLAVSCTAVSLQAAQEDMVVNDFESSDYAPWTATGDAFGKGPTLGALPGQMPVEGYLGKSLVNSFHGGDDRTGTLASPSFKIERNYLNFLIGGGGFPGETCMNLRMDGKIIHTATGPNRSPGGSERLAWDTWDLTGLIGKTVSLEIIDSRKGSWGHLNVDHIVQSDSPRMLDLRKQFTVNKRYLIWPVTRDTTRKNRFFLTLEGAEKPFAYYDICLTERPDFWVFTDLANFQGRKLTVTGKLPSDREAAWDQVAMSASYPGEETTYLEALRPQYHFTSRRGWLNDPNGLVWHEGQWHLFYQHNPYNHGWDNMTWGHAVSSDLYHWKERPPALFPDAEGYMYSGSAVVASQAQAGFPVKSENAIVLAYTANGRLSYLPGLECVQSIATSNDAGKTFQKIAKNPVIPHVREENRDPKVQWHEATRRWIMNLYYDGNDYAIYNSPDLVSWEKTCDYQIPGEGECPDMFELPVDGDAKNTRWVVWGANGKYRLGQFDGRTFTPETGVLRHYFGSAYAGQTYDNAPAGRRVHIGWMRDPGPGMEGAPFNLQMTLPMDFTLRTVNGGTRLWAEPSAEVETLRANTREWKNLEVISGGDDPTAGISGGQLEIEAVVDAAQSSGEEIGFKIFGDQELVWKRKDQTFSGMEGAQPPLDGKLTLRIFVDTVSVEVFLNGTYTSRYLRQKPGTLPIQITAKGGGIHFDSLRVHTLQSVWKTGTEPR